jgi:uncharacterized repeat protein (TIGR01451 family)
VIFGLALGLLPGSASGHPARMQAASADLQISMVDSPDPARYIDSRNSGYTYTITITNAGPDTAAGADVSFVIGEYGHTDQYGNPRPFFQGIGNNPQSFTTTQGMCQLGGAYLVAGFFRTELHCELGSLASGSAATVTVVVGAARYPPLSPGASEVVTNSASVSSDTADPDPNNNSATKPTTIVQGYADLALEMTQSPFPATAADDLVFTFVIRNFGPDAPRPFFAFTYSPLIDRVVGVNANTAVGCNGREPTGYVTCQFGPLASGGSAAITIRVTPGEPGSRSYSAVVGTGCFVGAGCTFASFALNPTPDSNPADNTVQIDEDLPAGQADLGVDTTASTSSAQIGEPVTYTLRVENHGPTRAHEVKLYDQLPAGLSWVSTTTMDGICTGGALVVCDLGRLEVGDVKKVTVVAKPTAEGEIVNAVSVWSSSRTVDSNLGDNTSAVTVTAGGTAPPPPPPSPPPPRPPPPPPPVVNCVVPKLVGQRLATANRSILRSHCTTGKIRHAYSPRQKGRIVSQSPRAGREFAAGTPIRLVVSKGSRPHPASGRPKPSLSPRR